MIRRPPRSTLFPTRRSSDLAAQRGHGGRGRPARGGIVLERCQHPVEVERDEDRGGARAPCELGEGGVERSEEHTSELQSRQYLVCRLLLEKKKTDILVLTVR